MDPISPREARTGIESSAGSSPGAEAVDLDALFTTAYDELCELARAQRRRWRGEETINTTVLVHELYLKLARQHPPLRNPACLFSVASRAMRHLLVNYARRQRALKRGGEMETVPLAIVDLPDSRAVDAATAGEVLALNEALERLGTLDSRQRDVVECRFFGSLSVEETASALELSPATVKRDWRLARAWLHRELQSGAP
jgi:RNA polymerase sigma factor (TIGR02999 family)